MISDLFVELLVRPFFSEKLRVLKYYDQLRTAVRLLNHTKPEKKKKGLSLLFELATSYPYRAQEVINVITGFVRTAFPQERPYEKGDNEIVFTALRSLIALPRLDVNGFPYNFDLHQVRVQYLDLTRANFRFFTLWGAHFESVTMSYASFEGADLGGTVFRNCSLEFADFSRAKLNFSFLDKRPTTFSITRLWRANLKDAEIDRCEIWKHAEEEGLDLKALEPLVQQGRVAIK